MGQRSSLLQEATRALRWRAEVMLLAGGLERGPAQHTLHTLGVGEWLAVFLQVFWEPFCCQDTGEFSHEEALPLRCLSCHLQASLLCFRLFFLDHVARLEATAQTPIRSYLTVSSPGQRGPPGVCSGLCLLSDTPAYSTSCWRRVGAQLSAG